MTESPFGYTNQRNYANMGLMDYNARFYSPTLGKFIQADTVIPDPTNSQAWNRYSYTINNPILYVDPSGNIPIMDGDKHPDCDNGLCQIYFLSGYDSKIAEKIIDLVLSTYNITLPDGVNWQFLDLTRHSNGTPVSYNHKNVLGVNPLIDGAKINVYADGVIYPVGLLDDLVYITSNGLIESLFNGGSVLDFASVLIHEARHAWVEYIDENYDPNNPNHAVYEEYHNLDPQLKWAYGEWDASMASLNFLNQNGASQFTPLYSTHEKVVAVFGDAYTDYFNLDLMPNLLPGLCEPVCD